MASLSAVVPSNVGLGVAVTVMAGLAVAVYSSRGSFGSASRRRKHALEPKEWNAFFTEDGRLNDGGVKFVKKVGSDGVHPSIRPQVWPFLLGVYDFNSTKEERDSILLHKHNEYENLRRQCCDIHKRSENLVSHDEGFTRTWQRIIRVDAVRANDEWVLYSPSQAAVSETKARGLATQVGLSDYDHLEEPCRIFHAARLVGILEAYAVYDPEIGYCQGMSDLLTPLIAVIEDDALAFWCFVGFMSKARHNFRPDHEVEIRRQLSMVSKIIKLKDISLYRHLETLEAEDCFFVYRMVLVMLRRELTFEQTLCLWEVMWADQAAIRRGIDAKAATEDLLLYAIAASVLQRRKTIIEKYSGLDEIMMECNRMAGRLDVWKLVDDAHDLVAHLHKKI